MQSKSFFAMTIVSNLSVEPLLVPSVNRIFEQNGIRIRIATVNYDEYCSAESLQRFAESDFIVILLNFENAYPGLLDGDSTTGVSEIVNFELEKARLIRASVSENSNASVLWFGYEDWQWNSSVVLGSQYALNGLVDKINAQIREELGSEITFKEKEYVYSVADVEDRRFSEIWTRKEAYIKRDDRNISLSSFRIDTFKDAIDRQIKTFCIGEYIISVCGNQTVEKIDLTNQEKFHYNVVDMQTSM